MYNTDTSNDNDDYPIYIFTYGTLKEGGRWNKALGLQGRKVATCTLKGYKIADCGYNETKDLQSGMVLNYPYMFKSPLSKVKGDIVRVDSINELRSILSIESEYTPIQLSPADLFLLDGTLPNFNRLIMTFIVDQPQGTLSNRISIKNSIYEWLL